MTAIFQGLGANTALSSINSNKFSHGSVSGVVLYALVCSFLSVFSSVFKNLKMLYSLAVQLLVQRSWVSS